MRISPQIGVGVELEGCFVDSEGNGLAKINNIPTTQYLEEKIAQEKPELKEHFSPEQLSVMGEVKSGVHPSIEQAANEIFIIRSLINQLLPEGYKLVFTPVLSKEFAVIPASFDPKSRSFQLFEKWSKTPQGRAFLVNTVTASTQINLSEPFASLHTEDEKLERAQNIMNSLSENADSLLKNNNPLLKDFRDKTRTESAFELLTTVKADQFRKRGFEPIHVVLPPIFKSVAEMQHWMCAHSNVDDFKDTDSKNEHGFLAKIKRDGNGAPWVLESRSFDAVDTPEEVIRLSRLFVSILDI